MPADSATLRVAIRTLGCKVNRADSDALTDALVASGAEVVDEADADVVVVNSCTVTGEADSKTRKAVRQALGSPNAPAVLVTGCMAVLDAGGLGALDPRVTVEPDKGAVVDAVVAAAAGPGGQPRVLQAGGAAERRGVPGRSLSERRTRRPRESAAPRTRVAVKVQDGCDDRCAYCIVPDARGPSRSVPAAEVVERVARLVAGGTAEVVLTGVNIGRFRDGGTSLAALIGLVAGTGVARIRISSIEPDDLTPGLLQTLSGIPSIAPHLHVPLQSGCDRTLAAMRRRYDTGAFADVLAHAREALPGLAVTTDVIVGFPGETDDDFAASLEFVEAAAFTRLHVFRYSARHGTPAADMPDQVDPRVSEARGSAMRSLGERLATAYGTSRVGGEASVLVETAGSHVATGTSEDYLSVGFKLDAPGDVRLGDIVRVELTAAERGAAFGHPVRW